MKPTNSRAGRFSKGARPQSAEPRPQTAPLNHEQVRLRKWISETRFKKVLFGGVSETDVWKKIGELNALYEAALSAERARYDTLLAQMSGSDAEEEIDFDE